MRRDQWLCLDDILPSIKISFPHELVNAVPSTYKKNVSVHTEIAHAPILKGLLTIVSTTIGSQAFYLFFSINLFLAFERN